MLFPQIVSMVSAHHRGPDRRRASLAALERDAAVQRVSRARRWVIGGVAALSAGITALVSSVAPGHTLKRRALTASRAPVAPRTANRMPPLASPGDLGLQSPASAPQSAPAPTPSAAADNSQAAAAPTPAPAPAPAPAVSGGS